MFDLVRALYFLTTCGIVVSSWLPGFSFPLLNFEDEISLRGTRCNDLDFYLILKSNISNIDVNDLPRLF